MHSQPLVQYKCEYNHIYGGIMNFGSQYRSVRLRRGLSIKQVKNELNSSTVSHFEINDQDINLSNWITLLNSIYMGPNEFLELTNKKVDNVDRIIKEIFKSYRTGNASKLEELRLKYETKDISNIPRFLVGLLVKSAICRLTETRSFLSEAEIDLVSSYLLEDNQWFKLEYISYISVCAFLSDRCLVKIYNKMMLEYRNFHLRSYQDLLLFTLLIVAVECVKRNNLNFAEQVINDTKIEEFECSDFYIKHKITFLELIIKFRNGQISKEKLVEFTKAIQVVDAKIWYDDKILLKNVFKFSED